MSVPTSRTAPSYKQDRHYLPDLPDQLKAYDEALCAWLAQMQFDYGSREDEPNIEPLRVVKASPERAFADLRTDKDYTLTEFENVQEQTPLPLASFTRTDLTVDMLRFKSVTNRHVGHLTKDQAEIYQWRFPLPYNFTYQVDFWTRYESTLDSMRVWTMLHMINGNYFYLPVDLNRVDRHYAVQNIFTQFGGISDTSDLEPGSEQRMERATMTLDVQGWILFPVEVAKTLLCGQIDVLIVPDDIPLQDPTDPDKINAAALDDAFIEDTIPFDFTQ